jgi:hypothetical protein
LAGVDPHICIVSVDTCDALLQSLLLLVLIRDDSLGLKVGTDVDLEPRLVGDPVAIPDRGWQRRDVAGHVMDEIMRIRDGRWYPVGEWGDSSALGSTSVRSLRCRVGATSEFGRKVVRAVTRDLM